MGWKYEHELDPPVAKAAVGASNAAIATTVQEKNAILVRIATSSPSCGGGLVHASEAYGNARTRRAYTTRPGLMLRFRESVASYVELLSVRLFTPATMKP